MDLENAELRRIEVENRMERVRNTSSKTNIANLTANFKRNMMERKQIYDVTERKNILKSIDYLKRSFPVDEEADIITKMTQFCIHNSFQYTFRENGCTISNEAFVLTLIIEENNVKNARICWFGRETIDAPAIQKLMNEQEFHLLGVKMGLFMATITSELPIAQRKIAYTQILELESHIGDGMQNNTINGGLFGKVIPRSDLEPFTIKFFAEKIYDESNDLEANAALHCSARLMMKTPVEGFDYTEVKGEYPVMLVLSYPVVCSGENVKKIETFLGIKFDFERKINLFTYFLDLYENYITSLSFRCGDLIQTFSFTPEMLATREDSLVHEVPVKNMNDIKNVIAVLRPQLLFNTIFEGMSRNTIITKLRPDEENPNVAAFNVSTTKFGRFDLNFNFINNLVFIKIEILSLQDVRIAVTNANNQELIQESFEAFKNVFQRSWSFTLAYQTLHNTMTELRRQNNLLENMYGFMPRIGTTTNQNIISNITPIVDAMKIDEDKIGSAWLSLFDSPKKPAPEKEGQFFTKSITYEITYEADPHAYLHPVKKEEDYGIFVRSPPPLSLLSQNNNISLSKKAVPPSDIKHMSRQNSVNDPSMTSAYNSLEAITKMDYDVDSLDKNKMIPSGVRNSPNQARMMVGPGSAGQLSNALITSPTMKSPDFLDQTNSPFLSVNSDASSAYGGNSSSQSTPTPTIGKIKNPKKSRSKKGLINEPVFKVPGQQYSSPLASSEQTIPTQQRQGVEDTVSSSKKNKSSSSSKKPRKSKKHEGEEGHEKKNSSKLPIVESYLSSNTLEALTQHINKTNKDVKTEVVTTPQQTTSSVSAKSEVVEGGDKSAIKVRKSYGDNSEAPRSKQKRAINDLYDDESSGTSKNRNKESSDNECDKPYVSQRSSELKLVLRLPKKAPVVAQPVVASSPPTPAPKLDKIKEPKREEGSSMRMTGAPPSSSGRFKEHSKKGLVTTKTKGSTDSKDKKSSKRRNVETALGGPPAKKDKPVEAPPPKAIYNPFKPMNSFSAFKGIKIPKVAVAEEPPAPIVVPEPKPEPKSEPKLEIKVDPKPETKIDPKPEEPSPSTSSTPIQPPKIPGFVPLVNIKGPSSNNNKQHGSSSRSHSNSSDHYRNNPHSVSRKHSGAGHNDYYRPNYNSNTNNYHSSSNRSNNHNSGNTHSSTPLIPTIPTVAASGGSKWVPMTAVTTPIVSVAQDSSNDSRPKQTTPSKPSIQPSPVRETTPSDDLMIDDTEM
uniref:Mediator complex subunit 1 n=1 Tax=Rhabditophanes sp. KR3021 TaxID=114890 RepID=A0AC35U3Z8_9BILA